MFEMPMDIEQPALAGRAQAGTQLIEIADPRPFDWALAFAGKTEFQLTAGPFPESFGLATKTALTQTEPLRNRQNRTVH